MPIIRNVIFIISQNMLFFNNNVKIKATDFSAAFYSLVIIFGGVAVLYTIHSRNRISKDSNFGRFEGKYNEKKCDYQNT